MRRLLLLVTVIACLLPVTPTSAAPAAPPRPQAVPPSGFADSLVSAALNTPIAVTGLPDGRALVLQKGGLVRVVKTGAVLPAAALSLTVCSQSERGLLGVTPDPNFGTNGQLYIYYTRVSAGAPGGCVNRVSRFTMVGDVIVGASELVLLDNISSVNGNHNGGDLEVGNDGFLYVAVGDGGCDPRGNSGCGGDNDAAQDLSLLNGKILRVDRSTGAPAAGNPYGGAGTAACRTRGNTPSTPTTICREIYAYGLRNPWRMSFDTNTGATRFYLNDVGQNAREEVNLGVLGANYGWPAREGVCARNTQSPCPPPDAGLGYTQPITDYSQDNTRSDFGGTYVTGGAFVPDGAWGKAYDGGYLFADGGSGRIFHRPAVPPMVPTSVYTSPFATGASGISDMGFVMESAGWALYYVLPGGQLRKIVFTTAPAALPGALAFVPVAPSQRAFDSRSFGGNSGPLRGGTSRLINVVATQGVHRSALVNITLVRPGAAAFATVWQPRATKPDSSNINGSVGHVTANSSIVPIDADGNVLLFVSATSHVIVDVLGFFDVAAGSVSTFGRFQAAAPIRAADTRLPNDDDTNIYTRTADGSASVVNVPIEGHWGVPTDTSSVAVIVTGLSGSVPGSGFAVALPHGGTVPASSTVNTNGYGDVRANLAVLPVGADGTIDLRLLDMAHVLVDVVGWFTDGTASSSGSGTYLPINPTRVVDTRSSLGFARLSAGGTGSVNSPAVPNTALGVSNNIVVTNTAGNGFITAFPQGTTRPGVSNGNATAAGQTRSAMALTQLGATGGASFYVSMSTDVIVDITGYFAA